MVPEPIPRRRYVDPTLGHKSDDEARYLRAPEAYKNCQRGNVYCLELLVPPS